MAQGTTLADQFAENSSPTVGGGSFQKFARIYSLTDKLPVQRRAILPGMFSLRRDERGWCRQKAHHGGYDIPRPSDPSKTNWIRFYCTEEGYWDNDAKKWCVTKECPKCVQVDAENEKYKIREAELLNRGAGDEERKNALKPFKDWQISNSCRRQWVANSMTEAGEFQLFGMSGKLKNALSEQITKVNNALKINSLSVKNLVFWEFSRSGSGKAAGKMQESATPVTEMRTFEGGVTAGVIKQVALTEEQMGKAMTECEDLEEFSKVEILRLTDAQIKALVDCSGDPEEVKAIVSQAMPATKRATAVPPQTASAPPPAPTSPPPAAPAPASQPKPPEAQAAKPASPPPAAPTPTENISDDDLFAELGIDPPGKA